MKRLLKISFDSLVFSLIPIIQWFVLGQLISAFYQLISTNIIIRKEKSKCLKI